MKEIHVQEIVAAVKNHIIAIKICSKLESE